MVWRKVADLGGELKRTVPIGHADGELTFALQRRFDLLQETYGIIEVLYDLETGDDIITAAIPAAEMLIEGGHVDRHAKYARAKCRTLGFEVEPLDDVSSIAGRLEERAGATAHIEQLRPGSRWGH